MDRIHRNVFAQGCGACARLVRPYGGRLYAYDAGHPPPVGTRVVSRAMVKRKDKRARHLVIWVVRCEPCAQAHEMNKARDELEETHPEGPWWRD